MILADAGNVNVIIDSDNSATDRAFTIRNNGTTIAGSTELLRVQEDGNLDMLKGALRISSGATNNISYNTIGEIIFKSEDSDTGADLNSSGFKCTTANTGEWTATSSTWDAKTTAWVVNGGTETDVFDFGANQDPGSFTNIYNHSKVSFRFNSEQSITASTTQTQAGGYLLSEDISIVTTVASDDDAVTLSSSPSGVLSFIANQSANRLQYFPATGGDNFSGLAANASATMDADESRIIVNNDQTTSSIFASVEESSFNGTFTGFASDPTHAVTYLKHGNQVTLRLPYFIDTSDATTMTMTGLPTNLQPTGEITQTIQLVDGGAQADGIVNINAGVVTFGQDAGSGYAASNFTGSGNKGVGDAAFNGDVCITYLTI
jgi:hypothetical protein